LLRIYFLALFYSPLCDPERIGPSCQPTKNRVTTPWISVILFKDLRKELLVKCSRAFFLFFWRVTLKKILTSHLSASIIIKERDILETPGQMQAIDKILDVLNNGDWHRIAEVAEETGTQESKIELISSFLSVYDFLEYDKKTRRIKLSTELRGFLKKITEIEQKENARRNS